MDDGPFINNIFKDRLGILKDIFEFPLRAVDIKQIVESQDSLGIIFHENTPTINNYNVPVLSFKKESSKEFKYNKVLQNINSAVLLNSEPYYFACLNENFYKYLSDETNNLLELNLSRLPSKIYLKPNFNNVYYEFYSNEDQTEIFEVSSKDYNLKKEKLSLKYKVYKNLFFNDNGIESFVEFNKQNIIQTNQFVSEPFDSFFDKDSIKHIIGVDKKLYVLLSNGDLHLGFEKESGEQYWNLIDRNILLINVKINNISEIEYVRGIDLRDNRLVIFNSLVSTGSRQNKKCRFLAKNFTFNYFGENFSGIQHGFLYTNGRIEGWQHGKYFVNSEPTTLDKNGNGTWSGKQYINGLEV